MKNLSKLMKVASIIAVGFLLYACNLRTKYQEPVCLCPPTVAPLYLFNFKLIDKTSGKDLVFDSGAKLTLSQIKVNLLVRGVSDSLMIQKDTVRKLLSFLVFPNFSGMSAPIDTVSLLVKGYSQNQLLYNWFQTAGCCPTYNLGSISLDGVQVCMPCDGFVATITK